MSAPATGRALDPKPGSTESIQALDHPAATDVAVTTPVYDPTAAGLPRTTILPKSAPETKDWAIYIFMRPDRALELAAWRDIQEMQSAMTGAGVHVVVQLDQMNDRHRLSVANGVVAALEKPDERRATPFEDLCAFIRWARQDYPGRQSMLIVWGHSRGVGVDLVGPRAEVPGVDPLTVTSPPITPSHVDPHPDALTFDNLLTVGALFKDVRPAAAGAAKDGTEPKRLELLGLDSCYMSSVEFAHALSGDVDRLVASQSYMKLAGWNYATILKYLRANPKATPAEFANAIVRHVDELADGNTLSHLDLRQSATVVAKFTELVKALRERAGDPRGAEALGILLKRVAYQKVRQFLDVRDLCHRVSDYYGGKVAEAADQVLKALRQLVVQARGSGLAAGRLNGVSIYYDGVSATRPFGGAAPDLDAVVDLQAYGKLLFVKDTGWADLMALIERSGSAFVTPTPRP